MTKAQNFKSHFDQLYGLNPKLYNGFIYDGFYGTSVKGQAFLYDDYINGNITLEGIRYENLLLNFDIYNQILVLKFNAPTGANINLELPLFKISEFKIGEDTYRVVAQEDSTFQVYQIVGTGQKQFWLKHEKKLEVETVSQQYKYQFTRDFVQIFYARNPDLLIDVNRNNTFIKHFNKEEQKQLKRWLRKNRIKIQKATPKQLKSLSQYIDQL